VFRTSITATAIRLLRYGSFPGMLIYMHEGNRKWFMRGDGVHDCLWPCKSPKPATVAADLMKGVVHEAPATTIQADGWIDHARSR
jgi:hypothetical protein